jgi:hypothetical protein
VPSRSRKQQRYLAAKFGPDWLKAHHFDRIEKSAPDPKPKKKPKRKKY